MVVFVWLSNPRGEEKAIDSPAKDTVVQEQQAAAELPAANATEPPAPTLYEFQANDSRNTLKGPHTEIADCAPCSDGKQVGGLFEGGSIQFNNVEVEESGKYIVTAYYVSGDPRTFYVKVNDKDSEKIDFPEVAKDDWESVGSFDFEIELSGGNNVLLFSDGDWYSPNLDRILIKKDPDSINVGQNPAFQWGDSANIGEASAILNFGDIKVSQHSSGFTVNSGTYQLLYNTTTGLSSYSWDGKMIAKGVYSSFKLNEDLVYNNEYDTHMLLTDQIEQIQDGHGKGIKFIVRNEKQGLPTLDQIYYVYEKSNYFIKAEEVSGSSELSSNEMAPVVLETSGGIDLGQYGDNRVLIVPFDNDAWARYDSKSMNTHLNTKSNISSEVTAIFDNASRNGLIVGSVTHDTWKTGIHWSGTDNRLDQLKVFGGFTSKKVTYDSLPHGAIKGKILKSPQIFVGFYSDYRDGMEAYGRANAVVAPPLAFGPNIPPGVPVGWNSWGAHAEHLSYDNLMAASNFFHDHLQNASFNNNGAVFMNMDSFWDNLSDEQLDEAVVKIRKNGQIPGTYHTPFVYWGKNMIAVVEGTDGQYTYGDIILKDSEGKLVPYGNGIALDPTHPGTKMKIDYDIARFKARGYQFIKLDFLTHATMEGKFYDEKITTGIQAYNEGMSYLLKQIGDSMFISESIAPIFPSQYAHSRRISCDIDGSASSTEYQLNSQTYGWWQNGTIYHYTDPDYMTLLKGGGYAGAQSRVNAAAISGTVYFSSDDATNKDAQNLMKKLLTNPRVNALAVKGKAFRNVEGNTGTAASDTFVLEDQGDYYLAVFNYGKESTEKIVDLERAGIPVNSSILDLWTNKPVLSQNGKLTLTLSKGQSVLYKLAPK
ncbi:carbohydrate-binding protein [Paenibacillus sp. GCM10012306]|uniref:carbohydrate-binding protein n=1 Tax=Paenibacillus sp. GCM10012306 TaxID=3317342 RepID=UPI0036167D4B